jgi:hypothetical protein
VWGQVGGEWEREVKMGMSGYEGAERVVGREKNGL